MAGALSPTMTLRDFENGYWYLDQLKNFAERIRVPAPKKLRKDELEKAIVAFLRTGKAALPTKRSLRKTGVKDVERGLSLKLRIENYTSNRETKDFIVEQAHRMAPEVREKSGVWYRLNRWREEQITSGKRPTYGNLVRQYIALNKMERFEKIPHGRYINFVAEFLAADKGVTRAEAIAAWTELKRLDVPKDYASWLKTRAKRKGGRGEPHPMKYFTPSMWRGSQTGGNHKQWEQAFHEYHYQLVALKDRLSEEAYGFFDQADVHDGELLEFRIIDGSRPAPLSGPKLAWETPTNYPVKIELAVFDAWDRFIWRLSYSTLRRTVVDFPGQEAMHYQAGGFGDWGYHELTDAGGGFLRHEILFGNGSILAIEFTEVVIS